MDQMLYYLKVQIYLPYSDVPRLVSYLLESIVCRSQYPMQDSLMNLILINVLSYWWFIIVLFYILWFTIRLSIDPHLSVRNLIIESVITKLCPGSLSSLFTFRTSSPTTCRGLAFSICSERPMPIFSHDLIGPTLLSPPSMCRTLWSPFRDQLQALLQDPKTGDESDFIYQVLSEICLLFDHKKHYSSWMLPNNLNRYF